MRLRSCKRDKLIKGKTKKNYKAQFPNQINIEWQNWKKIQSSILNQPSVEEQN